MPDVISLLSSDDEASPSNTLANFEPRKGKVKSSVSKPVVQNGRPSVHQTSNGISRTSTNGHRPAIEYHERSTRPTHSATASSTATSVPAEHDQASSPAELLQKDVEKTARKNGWTGRRSISPPPHARQNPPAKKSNIARRSGDAIGQERIRQAQEFQAQQKAKRIDRPLPRENTARHHGLMEMMQEPAAKAPFVKRESLPVSNGLTDKMQALEGNALKRKPSLVAQELESAVKRKRHGLAQDQKEPKASVMVRQSAEAKRRSVSSAVLEARPRPRRSLDFEEDSDDDSDGVPDMIPAKAARNARNATVSGHSSKETPNATLQTAANGVSARVQSTAIHDIHESSTPPRPKSSSGSNFLAQPATIKPSDLNPGNASEVAPPLHHRPPVTSVAEPPPVATKTHVPSTLSAAAVAAARPQSTGPASKHNTRYAAEEDARLIHLRQEAKVRWEDMPQYFQGRTQGSLQVRYSGLMKAVNTAKQRVAAPRGRNETETPGSEGIEYSAPARRKQKIGSRIDDGKANKIDIDVDSDAMEVDYDAKASAEAIQLPAEGMTARDVAQPSSLSRLVRARELGTSERRGRPRPTTVSDELKTQVFDTLGPRRLFNGTSRDVTCVAWASDGNRFAAGSIAISDVTSMQYNRPYNLLLGDVQRNSLLELPEHHVPRPTITDTKNVNSLHGMQETQDPRLFMTVAAVQFSNNGQRLFTAGGDGLSRMYDAANGRCLASFKHGATVDLLSWRGDTDDDGSGFLATACHRSDDEAIRVIQHDRSAFTQYTNLKPNRTTSTPVFPTTLKWGVAPAHRRYLLAGFSSDSFDEDRTAAGDLCLWDVHSGDTVPVPGSSRNVFDVAWNPSPGSGSTIFAVASAKAGSTKAVRQVRSVVHCYGFTRTGLRSIIEWESPALDINDVTYCPHDDNILAAGATDGKVYIWDKRFANRNQAPLHVFSHGETKNVLDSYRDVEAADTGVRFLSWSATANRLYSGSSDGVVKVWNPYRTTEDALVKNVATFKSAIMSGDFSPDYRDLLIGEDQGQLNLLSIDREGRSVHSAKRFDLQTAKSKARSAEDKFSAARELVESEQIQFRPMGALPVRQAVQGPNYRGPFIEPSPEHFDRLKDEYSTANAALQDAQWRSTNMQTQDPDISKSVQDAEARLSRVKDSWSQAQMQQKDALELGIEAQRLQHRFRAAETNITFMSECAKRHRLDGGYLPAAGDDDGEAPDDRTSEQRVPGILRTQRFMVDTSDLTNAEIADAGLTSKCTACKGPSAALQNGRAPLCSNCALIRSGLTACCTQCSIPVRPPIDNSQRLNLCQRCDFRCLRCKSTADLTLAADMVQCESCGLVWEVGVLGFELKDGFGEKTEKKKRLVREDGEEFGGEEMERLAGGWRVPLVDGTL